MNDVGLEFKGDAREALAAYEKMIEAQNKQIAKLQQASDTSKKGHSEFQGQVAEQIKSLASMAAGYVTIQSAVGFVTGAYREWKQEIMALGAEHTKFSQTLVRDLVQAGDIKRGPEIEAWLNTLPAGGATLEQGRAALAAVTAASPSQTLERRMGIAAEVTRGAPLGVDLAQVGALAGEFADLQPGMSPRDLMDKAMQARALAGGNAGKLAEPGVLRMVTELQTARGESFDEALGTVLSALDSNVKMKGLESNILKRGGDLTAGGLIPPELVAANTAALSRSSGFTAEQLGHLDETVAGRSVLAGQGVESRAALAKRMEGLLGEQMTARGTELTGLLQDADVNYVGRHMARGNQGFAEFLGAGAGQTELFREARKFFGDDSPQVQAVRELVAEQRKQTEMLQKQLDAANRRPVAVTDGGER